MIVRILQPIWTKKADTARCVRGRISGDSIKLPGSADPYKTCSASAAGVNVESHIAAVEPAKAHRLLNHGPTVLVSAQHDGVRNVMAAAWACALDFTPPKLTVVLDKSTATRRLIEASGTFVIQVPTVAQLQLTMDVGTRGLNETPDKLERAGVQLFSVEDFELPFVSGCAAWLACRLVPEPHNQQTYDLFIGEIVGAWSDTRVFSEGHWHFENADPALRSLHYIAGGNFYAIGDALQARTDLPG